MMSYKCTDLEYVGIQTRMRHVIITPRFGGRLCPTAMTQSRSCSHVDCFKWHVTEWGDCQIEVRTSVRHHFVLPKQSSTGVAFHHFEMPAAAAQMKVSCCCRSSSHRISRVGTVNDIVTSFVFVMTVYKSILINARTVPAHFTRYTEQRVTYRIWIGSYTYRRWIRWRRIILTFFCKLVRYD